MGLFDSIPINQPLPKSDGEIALSAAQPNLVADVFLQWVYSETGGLRTELAYPEGFYPSLAWAEVEEAQERLLERKLIQLSWQRKIESQRLNRQIMADHERLKGQLRLQDAEHQRRMADINPRYLPVSAYIEPPPPYLIDINLSPEIQLTTKGIAKAEQSSRRWADKVLRNRAARDHLLAWLYDQVNSRQISIAIRSFFANPKSIFEGHFLSVEDIEEARIFLSARDLVKSVRDGQSADPRVLQITSRGIDCMEQGGNVAGYLTSRQDRAKYIINGISGGNVTVGDNPTQNNIINGADADTLRTLIEAIAHVLPSLGLDTQNQKEAEEAASQIISETRVNNPSRGNLRAALGKLRNLLSVAGNEALVRAVDYEMTRLGIPGAG